MSDFYSVTEAARMALLSNVYIIEKINAGEIKAQKMGTGRGIWLIDRVSFDAWLAKRRQNQRPDEAPSTSPE